MSRPGKRNAMSKSEFLSWVVRMMKTRTGSLGRYLIHRARTLRDVARARFPRYQVDPAAAGPPPKVYALLRPGPTGLEHPRAVGSVLPDSLRRPPRAFCGSLQSLPGLQHHGGAAAPRNRGRPPGRSTNPRTARRASPLRPCRSGAETHVTGDQPLAGIRGRVLDTRYLRPR